MSKIDLKGKKFGRLTVVADVGRTSGGGVVWRCRCACGNTADVAAGNLKSGGAKSCGCLRSENSRKRWVHQFKFNPSTKRSVFYEGGDIEDLEDLIR